MSPLTDALFDNHGLKWQEEVGSVSAEPEEIEKFRLRIPVPEHTHDTIVWSSIAMVLPTLLPPPNITWFK